MKARVALSAVTSFTGAAIAQKMLKAGYEVHGFTSGSKTALEKLKALRVNELGKGFYLHENVLAEDGQIAKKILEVKPDLWVHHHHHMVDFRSPNYDIQKAKKVGINSLEELTFALAEVKCKGIIYSGSYFEPGEGGPKASVERTPYAQSKKQVWERLCELASEDELNLSKVVIPNPFGPLENPDRLIPTMIRFAKSGQPLKVTSPNSQSDNIYIDDLVDVYLSVAENLLEGDVKVVRPSSWVVSTSKLIETISTELIEKRLKLSPSKLEVVAPAAGSETFYENPQAERKSVDLDSIFDRYAEIVVKKGLL